LARTRQPPPAIIRFGEEGAAKVAVDMSGIQ
jgi:hypothetical protein